MDNCPACDKPRDSHTPNEKLACEKYLNLMMGVRQARRFLDKDKPERFNEICKDAIDYMDSKKSKHKVLNNE